MAKTSVTEKRQEILEAALAGYDTPAAASEQVFASVDPELVAEVKKLMNSVEFNRELQQSKEDVVGTAINSLKRTVMENVREMKELAKNSSDPRVRYNANKDILDRVGLAPTQKADVRFTPTDYHKIVEGFKKRVEGLGKRDGEADSGSDGMVPETGSSTPEGSSGS
jgi:hypothetical protein